MEIVAYDIARERDPMEGANKRACFPKREVVAPTKSTGLPKRNPSPVFPSKCTQKFRRGTENALFVLILVRWSDTQEMVGPSARVVLN